MQVWDYGDSYHRKPPLDFWDEGVSQETDEVGAGNKWAPKMLASHKTELKLLEETKLAREVGYGWSNIVGAAGWSRVEDEIEKLASGSSGDILSFERERKKWAETIFEAQQRQDEGNLVPLSCQWTEEADRDWLSGRAILENILGNQQKSKPVVIQPIRVHIEWCEFVAHRIGAFWLWLEGRSLGGGNGNPLQYPCLDSSMARGAWWATVHGVTKYDMTECAVYTRMHTHTDTHKWLLPSIWTESELWALP